jgi:hypothetical protein
MNKKTKPALLRALSVMHLSTVFISATLLTGCDGKNSFSAYSNYDLKSAYAGCKSKDLSPGGAQRCRNIEKECKKRKSDSGFRC